MNGSNQGLVSGKILGLIILFVAFLQGCATSGLSPFEGSSGEDQEVFDTLPAVDDGQYVLQPGDQIYIQVFNDADLTMQATIGQSGSINYSYLGAVEVAGQTAEQLAVSITEKLSDGYLKNPAVNITVQQYGSFFIAGQVQSPGSYRYEPGLTLAKAVTLAGGKTDRASGSKMFLEREVDGEKKSFRVKLSEKIQPGDIITIKEGLF